MRDSANRFWKPYDGLTFTEIPELAVDEVLVSVEFSPVNPMTFHLPGARITLTRKYPSYFAGLIPAAARIRCETSSG
jgi:hypothetical protein